MDILVIGGTRFFGVHLVKNLLKEGHNVTIATRGLVKDDFGSSVKRIIIERKSKESLEKALGGQYYDVIYDNQAYCSNDIKNLLEVVKTARYLPTSTLSVYKEIHPVIMETEYDPLAHPLKWCNREDDTYDETKRQMEAALFQVYGDMPSVATRFPFVVGEDDYTKRLYFYVEHAIKAIPMDVNNLNEGIGFIRSADAGAFLAWMKDNDFTGPINASNKGNISMGEVLDYVESKTGIKAILSQEGEKAPYNGADEYNLVTDRAKELGYEFPDVREWIFQLLDTYIERAKA